MSLGQKTVIFLGMLAIVCMVAYPPYTGVYVRSGDNLRKFMGYGSYFEPPTHRQVHNAVFGPLRDFHEDYRALYSAYVDSRRLTIQVSLCVLLVVGGVALQVRRPPQIPENLKTQHA